MRSEKITVVIPTRGEGSRMKCFSPKPKHLLYYMGKRIIDHIKDAFEGCEIMVLEGPPTKSRTETLDEIRHLKNAMIVDCDIIPVGWDQALLDDAETGHYDWDTIWFFKSDNPKYGGLYMDNKGLRELERVCEKGDTTTKCRSSGIYFLKDVGATLDRMTDPNSVASGMIGAKMILENTFIRVGDPEDYLNALK